MKRLHIHVGVDDLDRGIQFYNALFGAAPVKTKGDYAKWLLDDPAVNFVISTRAAGNGVDHLGLQADDDSELEEVRARLRDADLATFDEGETVCCYARSDKTWVRDPAGIAWEAYRTMADAAMYAETETKADEACCTPETKGQPGCCEPVSDTGACCEG